MRNLTRWLLCLALVPLVSLLASIAAPGLAQAWVAYDASKGTLPQAQGWTLNEQVTPPLAYPVGVASGDLHLSTLGFGNNVPADNGGGVWWSRSDVVLDFSTDFAVEANIRIDSAPDHSVNAGTGWPRPGYGLAVYDALGRIFWIGLGSGEVFLSNTAFGQYGSANTVTTAFNTTDAHHVYRIERAAGGVGAALRIDGVLRLVLPALGPVENAGGYIYFGDPTYWANSDSHTAWVRYSEAVLGVGSPSGTGVLWARALGCPASHPRVAFSSKESGTLWLEIFDAAGRQVARSARSVAAGQSGSLEAVGAQRSGLYFYRVRLASASGGAFEVSGRIVILR